MQKLTQEQLSSPTQANYEDMNVDQLQIGIKNQEELISQYQINIASYVEFTELIPSTLGSELFSYKADLSVQKEIILVKNDGIFGREDKDYLKRLKAEQASVKVDDIEYSGIGLESHIEQMNNKIQSAQSNIEKLQALLEQRNQVLAIGDTIGNQLTDLRNEVLKYSI
jgi:hypothetical protein